MGQELKARFTAALDAFVEKVQQDRYVLAVILAGSLYHDVVWAKSDIDVILIAEETKTPTGWHSFVEDGIIINANIFDRQEFKRRLNAGLRSGPFHAWLSQTTLLFTRDETLRELYASLSELGEHDKEVLLFRHGSYVLGDLAKAEKFLLVKHDPLYSHYWLMRALHNLAMIEVVLHDGIPGRDVLQQALALNEPLFGALYRDLGHSHKDEAVMRQALSQVEGYITAHTPLLFRPVLEILAEKGTAVGFSELHERFAMTGAADALLVDACEYLAEQGIIEKLSAPVEVTRRSRPYADEVAYYYAGGNGQ